MEHFAARPDEVRPVAETHGINPAENQGETEARERPEQVRISLDTYNADMHRRYLGMTSGERWIDIYLLAQKRWENDDGFEYGVDACRDRKVSNAETGESLSYVSSDNGMIGLGFKESEGAVYAFVESNPEISAAAERLGGVVQPELQAYGYGIIIRERPDQYLVVGPADE